MKKIGFIGLGKLGLPCAVAMMSRGADVMGHDLDPTRMNTDPQSYHEAGPDGTGDFNEHLAVSDVRFGTLEEVVRHAEILFIAVQTPHEPRFEGVTPLSEGRADFDYSHLVGAVSSVCSAARHVGSAPIIVVISTTLPGTCRRLLLPMTDGLNLSLVYNPFFIAMGTTMRDFLHPEFVLLGSDHPGPMERIAAFYRGFHAPYRIVPGGTPIQRMSLESAELTKVAYNTFIGQKIVFANTVMEICERFSKTDCDDVIDALSNATDRLISSRYLRGGMGDGGGCHPRDGIAMSWLARELNLSHDLFGDVMQAREDQARWLAMRWRLEVNRYDLAPCLLGYAFKPGTNLTVGSAALLVEQLYYATCEEAAREGRIARWDQHVEGVTWEVFVESYEKHPRVFLIGCRHPELPKFPFAAGSVVIDPFRYVPDREGVEVIRLGAKRDE